MFKMAVRQQEIQQWALGLGLAGVSFTDCDLSNYHQSFADKVDTGHFGEMGYLERNVDKRFHPQLLHEGTRSIITVRMHYFPPDSVDAKQVLADSSKAYISRYALGRDYHKVFRKKLKQLAEQIAAEQNGFDYRVFSDSAPVMELALAQKSGLGWLGKNSCILHKEEGSWFFLGEIYTNLSFEEAVFPVAQTAHCGSCDACLRACPTDAFTGPYALEVQKCISYLTIEFSGSIPVELRPLMGNRIYGCDDCQLVCPWNRFGKTSENADFKVRHGLDNMDLATLWQWDEATFLQKFAGSAVRRIGYEKWQRNLAVAIGNSGQAEVFLPLLQNTVAYSALTQEHIDWAKHCLRT